MKKENLTFEYPLKWIISQPRTKRIERARFGNHSPSKAGDYLISELERMGARYCVISSNLQVRSRGDGFYANQRVLDAGVVIYFQFKDKSKAMACDMWDKVEHNLWALYLSVQAIRGLERWGGSEFLDGLFTGFTALPPPSDIVMNAPNYFEDCTGKKEATMIYRDLAKQLHPDMGGSADEFSELQRQYREVVDN